MTTKVTPVQMWSGEIEDKPGGAAEKLKSLAEAKINLEFVIARRNDNSPGKGIIFVAPIQGPKAEAAASAAGLKLSSEVAGIRVEGDNKPGAGFAITQAVGEAGVSFRGLSATVVGKKYVCFFALDSQADVDKATAALKKKK